MTSRSPSPASRDFADSCFLSENDSNKRRRDSDRSSSPAGRPSNKLVAETLLPVDSQSSQGLCVQPNYHNHPQTAGFLGIVQETASSSLVPSSQTDSVVPTAVTVDTGAPNSENEASENEEAAHLVSMELPPEWTAGKTVCV